MVRMVDPKEGDIICDPASGSGGFLIRFFELVRQQILADADRQYQEYKAKLEADKKLSAEKKASMLRAKFDEIQATLDPNRENSRFWTLANRCIYGTDANDRMARTSKMNMIMHGDGHGGVHHHDGFLNVNGIFEGRFDIILTNPPFGANVEPSDKILDEQVTLEDDVEREYVRVYGTPYKEALARVRAARDKPIASLFALPRAKGNGPLGKIKTELLFIERCLDLLKPGGRLGIVLPESVFNNPSLAYVREFCEDRAHIHAVIGTRSGEVDKPIGVRHHHLPFLGESPTSKPAARSSKVSLRLWDGLPSRSRAAARASARLRLPAFISIAAARSPTRLG
jgi:type I restriction enzyme M protein